MNRKTAPPVRDLTGLDIPGPRFASLRNGIPAALIRTSDEPFCRLDLVFEAGSRYQDRLFTASFTNQMMPEGTKSLTGAQIAEEFEYYGCYFNAASDRDHAEFTLHLPDKYLEPVLKVFSDLLFNPVFPEEELEIIRQNRIQSLIVDDQRVESISKKAFNRAVFGRNHPYGQVGEAEDVSVIHSGLLKEFHSTYYHPGNCRLLITGNDPEAYLRMADDYLGDQETWGTRGVKPVLAPLPEPDPVAEKRIRIVREGALQSSIRIGKALFSRNHPDFPGLSVVNTILGGYFGSRLMKNIREEKGLTYGISSGIASLRDHGFFYIGSEVEANSWEIALKECFLEINSLIHKPVGQQELKLVKNYLTGQVQRSVDGPLQIAEQFRNLWLQDLDFSYLGNFIRTINEITPEQIRELAIKYLDPAGMIEVIAGP